MTVVKQWAKNIALTPLYLVIYITCFSCHAPVYGRIGGFSNRQTSLPVQQKIATLPTKAGISTQGKMLLAPPSISTASHHANSVTDQEEITQFPLPVTNEDSVHYVHALKESNKNLRNKIAQLEEKSFYLQKTNHQLTLEKERLRKKKRYLVQQIEELKEKLLETPSGFAQRQETDNA